MKPRLLDATESELQAMEDWRYRCLLAQSLVSHRRTTDGMDAAAVELLWQALNGRPTAGA